MVEVRREGRMGCDDEFLVVMESDGPSDKWFRLWERWFLREAGAEHSESVRRLFRYAKRGAALELMSRQIREQSTSAEVGSDVVGEDLLTNGETR